jgi:hypothetical protein
MNHCRHDPTGRTGGYTLLEMSIALVMLVMVVGAMVTIGVSSDRSYRTGTTAAHLEAQVETAIERIVSDLRIARLDSLTPDPAPGAGTVAIEYVQPVGIVNGVVQWSPLRRLAFEYDPRELNDGLDNDSDGLVDEGMVVLTEDVGGPGQRRHVITRWVRELAAGEVANGRDDNNNGLVDEPGFFVERFDKTIVVHLTLEKKDGEGRLRTRTVRTSARMRN